MKTHHRNGKTKTLSPCYPLRLILSVVLTFLVFSGIFIKTAIIVDEDVNPK
jgi:hypothetical protein